MSTPLPPRCPSAAAGIHARLRFVRPGKWRLLTVLRTHRALDLSHSNGSLLSSALQPRLWSCLEFCTLKTLADL